MAAQRRTAVELAKVLNIGHRAALPRVNGDHPFSLGELATTAEWLGVTVTSFMVERTAQPAVA